MRSFGVKIQIVRHGFRKFGAIAESNYSRWWIPMSRLQSSWWNPASNSHVCY